MDKQVLRGELYFADLNPIVGSEQGGIRPVLIIQNDIGNKHSPTVIVAAVTSKDKPHLPTHISLAEANPLKSNSIAMLEQIRTLDKRRLKYYIGKVSEKTMSEINTAIFVSFGIEYM